MLTTKKRFIKLLRKKFEDHDKEIYQSYGDADVLIVAVKAIQRTRDEDILL